MARIRVQDAGGQNRVAFLDVLAASEIGDALLALTDNGYDCLVGSVPDMPLIFKSYARHPNRIIVLAPNLESSAAGRYQFLSRDWIHYRDQLGLPDFGPLSQDRWALQLMKEAGALEWLDSGAFDVAVGKCAHLWASLPSAGYGQHENSIAALRAVYVQNGGIIS